MHFITHSTTKFHGLLLFVFILNAVAFGQPNFDFDGKADLGVYRSSDRTWYSYSTESRTVSAAQFGLNSDVQVPADYDGDGITDVAVWRPSNGVWYVWRSSNNQLQTIQWGTTLNLPFGTLADIPVPFDYDGDDQADFAVYRADSGTWYILESTQGYDSKYAQISRFGGLADVPVPADYDGDGKTDLAVFRTPESRWYIWESATGNLRSVNLGQQGADLLVPADYTGDGKADPAVYHAGTWLIERSQNRQLAAFSFGNAMDIPAPADYDGDGHADMAVFRDGTWFVFESSTLQMRVSYFGAAGDYPVNSAYVRQSIVAAP